MRGGKPPGGLIRKNENSLDVGEQDGRDWGREVMKFKTTSE